MKQTIIALVLISLMFVGCGDNFDTGMCLQGVNEKYPKAKVFIIPEHEYKYIVVTDSSVLYVEMLNTWKEPTKVLVIKKLK